MIPQISFALLLLFAIALHKLSRRCHARNGGNIFCPGASLIFVRAAEMNWFNRNSAAQKQKAGALGTVKFVRRKTGGID